MENFNKPKEEPGDRVEKQYNFFIFAAACILIGGIAASNHASIDKSYYNNQETSNTNPELNDYRNYPKSTNDDTPSEGEWLGLKNKDEKNN